MNENEMNKTMCEASQEELLDTISGYIESFKENALTSLEFKDLMIRKLKSIGMCAICGTITLLNYRATCYDCDDYLIELKKKSI